MTDLNLSQIENKLNSEFNSNSRVLLFWYDKNQDFKDDINNIKLENAKIHYLTENNLFETKVLLEIEDKESNYLIYAPYEKPDYKVNHLADTIIYSKEFFADKLSLIMNELNIDISMRSTIEKYSKFFNAKDRINKFSQININPYSNEEIELAIMASLLQIHSTNFDDILEEVVNKGLDNNLYLKEFEKFNILDVFWDNIKNTFSYNEDKSLIRFMISVFITYLNIKTFDKIPKEYRKYLLNKDGNIINFVNKIMNNRQTVDSFIKNSNEIYKFIDGDNLIKKLPIDNLIDIDIFKEIDEYIIHWLVENLKHENLNLDIKNRDFIEICKNRKFKYYSNTYQDDYNMLINAYNIIKNKDIYIIDDFIDLVDEYDRNYYKIDKNYRKFYYYYDKLANSSIYEELETLIENIYTNNYLDNIIKAFNKNNSIENMNKKLLQRNFYSHYIENQRQRIIVIISDALRYEVAKELVDNFDKNEKINAEIRPFISMLPSITSLGMASLLPNTDIDIDDDFNIFVDNNKTHTLDLREKILKKSNINSLALQYDNLIKMKNDELKMTFKEKEVIYIYHNNIDAIGDKLNTENKVFNACDESIKEIEKLIMKLTNTVSATNFIVTADHGFIYTRGVKKEYDKIDKFYNENDKISKRYIISENNYDNLGTKSFKLKDLLSNDDNRYVISPITSTIFKAPGNGLNYYHGGSSPQECIIPLIEVNTIRGKVDTENVEINPINTFNDIRTSEIKIDFIQKDAITDRIKPANYKIRFLDKNNTLISDEFIYMAKSTSENIIERIFEHTFKFKNQEYSRSNEYYFVITNIDTGVDIYKETVIIDIPFF